MPRFNPQDIREILDMLEDEITSLRQLDRIEKMKMKGQIRRQIGWISALSNPSGEMIYQRLEDKLSHLFSLYSYDFKARIKRLLEDKSQRVRSLQE
jgi:hypothetical protein